MFGAMAKGRAENASRNEDDIDGGKMRKWAGGEAARISGPREEKEGTQEGGVTEIGSEGSSSPETSTTMKDNRTVQDNRSEGSGSEERKLFF